jgi:hypothetical protein
MPVPAADQLGATERSSLEWSIDLQVTVVDAESPGEASPLWIEDSYPRGLSGSRGPVVSD